MTGFEGEANNNVNTCFLAASY